MPEQPYHSDPHSLHTSRRETLQRCPRKFFIEYVLGLERIDEDKPGLRMGDAHAKALEMADPNAVMIPYQPLIEACTDEYKVKALIEEAKIVRVYATVYLEIYPAASEREVIWDLPIPGTEYRNCGTMDFVEKHPSGIGVFGGEDKLKAQWTGNDEKALDLDDQATGEIYGMIGAGYSPVLGLKYRVTKKSGIRQRMKRMPETFDEFLERLEDKVRDERSDHFMEYTITRTSEELKEFEEELQFTADYIDWMVAREAANKPTFPKSPKTCSYIGGCQHPEICGRYPDWKSLYRRREDRQIVTPTPEQLKLLVAAM